MLFDSHTHINNENYGEFEREALIEEIEASLVSYVMDIGFDYPSSVLAVENAKKKPWINAVIGVHPHDAKTMSDQMIVDLANLSLDENVKAIGEIGLDFYYDKSERDVQEYWFRRQIRLANELGLPMVIHSREADALTMEILKEEGAFAPERQGKFPKRPGPDGTLVPDSRVVIHCFSGSAELAKEYVKLGATIGICGPVTFKNNRKTKEVVAVTPIEYLMVETDAPYLTPVPFRGKPNKSPYVEYTAREVAEIKGIDFEEAARITLENGKRFFAVE